MSDHFFLAEPTWVTLRSECPKDAPKMSRDCRLNLKSTQFGSGESLSALVWKLNARVREIRVTCEMRRVGERHAARNDPHEVALHRHQNALTPEQHASRRFRAGGTSKWQPHELSCR
jgi:hypothetical protein